MARCVVVDVDTSTDDAGTLLLAATSPGLDRLAAPAGTASLDALYAARGVDARRRLVAVDVEADAYRARVRRWLAG